MADFLGFDLSRADVEAWLAQAQVYAWPRLWESLGHVLLSLLAWGLVGWITRRLGTHWIKKTETLLDDILLEMVRRILQLSIAFWLAWRLAYVWDLPQVATVVSAFWILGVTLPASRAVSAVLKVVETTVVARTESKLDDTALPWVNRIISWGIVALGAVTALHRLGISITPLLAGASIFGVAISFAAKDTLSNLIAGVLLIVDRPFEVGDRIEIWGAPAEQANWGDIVEIGIRATKIRTPDNIMVIIPNNEIMRRDIINYTASGSTIRLRIPIGIAYDANVEAAKALCLQAAEECAEVDRAPEPVCIVRGFGASSVDLELRVWLRDARQRRAVGDWITERVKTLFDSNGIEIPYPKRDLYIKQAPGAGPWAAPPEDSDR
jgi:small-conductance mechanosensitive channel